MLSYFIDKLPASWQAGLVQITHPIYKKFGFNLDIDQVYRDLGVSRSSAYESARLLAFKLETPQGSLKEERKQNKELRHDLNKKSFEADIFRHLQEHPEAWSQGERHQLSSEFKVFLLAKKREYNLDWGDISAILGIPEDTLKKFKHQVESKGRDNGDGSPPSLPESIVDLIRRFFQARQGKATARGFCEAHPEVLRDLEMTYPQFANLLLKLGLTSPNGIFLNNTGLDKIIRFVPHAIWGTDGKLMKIIINGRVFRWIWQCLIDYKSTVLVGGFIGESETTDNLLEAIQRSKENTGVTPMAIVIDGRLSENLPAIRAYLDAMGIEIIRTFPGNPKSAGITEGNFSIFEKWVGGQVVINGETPEKLSRSIAEMLTEVFTQLRNNQPRRGFEQKTPAEVAEKRPKLSPEEEKSIRAKLHALANRFRNEQALPIMEERKAQALEQAIKAVNPPDKDIFTKRLGSSLFTTDMILEAIAIFERQRQKYPEKTIDHTYYGGILRNLTDQRNVELLYTQLDNVYAEHWACMEQAIREKGIKPESAEQMCQRLASEFFEAKIPAHGWITLAHLQSAFMLAAKGGIESAMGLRQRLAEHVKKSKLACAEKRQRLLRKLFECEAMTRQMIPST